MRYILKQGNSSEEITPSVGFLPNSVNLFVKMLSSKNRQETLYSSKNIEPNRLYSLCVTFSIDYENDLTDILLYLDGVLDSQISVPGEPLHNKGKIHLGKVDKNSLGFIGYLADVLIVPRPLYEMEINQISRACFINLINNTNSQLNLIKSYEIFERKFERDILLEKYSQHTGSPISVLENLDLLNDELREIVRKFDENFIDNNSENNEDTQIRLNTCYNIYFPEQQQFVKINGKKITLEEHSIYKKLQYFLGDEDSEGSIFCRKISMNATFIYSVFYLLSEDQTNLSPKRILNSFEIMKETMHLSIEENNLINLAKILDAYEKNLINFLNLIRSIHYYSRLIFTNLNLKAFKNIPKTTTSISNNNFITQMPFGNTNNNYRISSSGFNNIESNSLDLHENFLFKSSRQFYQNLEEDIENNNFMKTNISIKSLYSRPKTGTRPGTTRGFGVNPITNSGEDYVNQCNFDELEEIHQNNNYENYEKKNNDDISNKDPNKLTNMNIENKSNIYAQENSRGNSSQNKIQNNFENDKRKMTEKSNKSKNESNINDNGFDSANVKINEEININDNINNNNSNSNNNNEYYANEDNEEEIYEEDSKEQKLGDSSNNKNEIVRIGNGEELADNNENNNNETNDNYNDYENNIKINYNNNNTSSTNKINKSKTFEKDNISKNTENLEKLNQKTEQLEKQKTEKTDKTEFNAMVSDLDKKIILSGKNSNLNIDEVKDQFNDEENLIPIKQSQMIDNNIQVDGDKIEEEYKDENEENMQIDMDMEIEMEEHISVFNLEARYTDDWNMGEFEIIINHCFDCHKHKTSTRHFEFVNKNNKNIFLFILSNFILLLLNIELC
jgi:hypothetical protein